MRTRFSVSFGLCLLVLLSLQPLSSLASVSSGVAVTIDGVTTSGGVTTPDAYVFNTTGGGGAGQFASTPSCSALACGVDGPAISVYLTSGNPSVTVHGAISYTVTVVGAPGPVPILLTGQYDMVDPLEGTGRSGGTELTGEVKVRNSANSATLFSLQSRCYNYDPFSQEQLAEAFCGAGMYQGSFMATAGTTLAVTTFIDITRHFADRDLPPASGYLDPFFQIDPVFAASHPGYSLVFDPGVDNGMPGAIAAAPVPEPETLLLMAGGLAALALKRRRFGRAQPPR